MPVLTAAVVLVAVLCVANMMITFAALRRLKEYGEQLASRPAGAPGGAEVLVGRSLPEVAATTVRGEPVTRERVAGRLVGFFSASCEPCHAQAREFAEFADPERIAFVSTTGASEDDVRDMLALLDAAPAVVRETGRDGLTSALGVQSFPSLVRTDAGGTVTQAANALRALAVPA